MKNYLLLILLFCGLSVGAQDQTFQRRVYRTLDYMKQQKVLDRNTIQTMSQLEHQMKDELRFEAQKNVTIPVVFHILYSNEAQKISADKLQLQLEILNEDFGAMTSESFEVDPEIGDRRNLEQYNTLRAETRIDFCFPELQMKKTDVSVINYHQTNVDVWTDFNSMKSKKGALPVDPDRFLNIWVCALEDDNAGYAQMPCGGSTRTDGIVIDYRFIKNIFEADQHFGGGHTLTHLMGNYLGLFPLWGEGDCTDDYVDDTPIHNAPNYRCESLNHVSTCMGNPTEMINNFMDNTYDACLTMFTRGQMARMQMVLAEKGPRGQLSLTETDCMNELPEEETLATAEEKEEEKVEVEIEKARMRVFPNPVQQKLMVDYISPTQGTNGTYEVSMFSVNGTLQYSKNQSVNTTQTQIDVSNWQSGTYVLVVVEGEQKYNQIVVVETNR